MDSEVLKFVNNLKNYVKKQNGKNDIFIGTVTSIEPLNIELGLMLNKVNHTFPKDSKANSPNITDGIPLNTWNVTINNFRYFLYKRYLINNADFIPKGMAIIIAINEVNIVILKGTQKEYLLLVAAKSPWNKIFANPKDWNPLIAYEKIKITKVIKREIIDKANPNEIHFAILLI